MKIDGGSMREDSPKMVFAGLKKIIKEDCLKSLNTITWKNLVIVSGTKSELIVSKIITI